MPRTPTAEIPRFEPGQTIADRYLLEKKLGEGAMGAVFAAHDLELYERVALKLLLSDSHDSRDIDMFRRELRLARRVTHRNVVRCFDLGRHGDQYFLTMELFEGRSLKEVVEADGPVSLPLAVQLIRQLAEGLAAAHEVGVVHRDLKPSNIMVGPDGRVAIADFGVARAYLDEPGQLTKQGFVVGTPAYMAPEQMLGYAVGPAADLYSLGLIAYELTVGTTPHEQPTETSERKTQDDRTVRRPRSVPGPLAELISECMARDPQARPAGAREIMRRIDELSLSEASEPDQPAPGGTVRIEDDQVATQKRSSDSTAPSTSASIAVLPFRAGSEADQVFADGLGLELTDRLCRIDGMVVFGSSATGATRDPRALGRELGVGLVVDGMVLRSGDRARLTVRLFDATSGAQLWSEREDCAWDDILDLQDRLALKVAETLRVDFLLYSPIVGVSGDDVQAYLRARSQLRGPYESLPSVCAAAKVLEDLSERLPGFGLAIAGHADAKARLSFHPGSETNLTMAQVDAAVDRALRDVPWLPETQLAAARRFVQKAQYAEASAALNRALRTAPSFASALTYLGNLEIEAGRADQGMRRIELAHKINPEEAWVRTAVARRYALLREYDRAEQELQQLVEADPRFGFALTFLRFRFAVWRDARDEAEALRLPLKTLEAERPYFTMLFGVWTGDIDPSELADFGRHNESLRARSFSHQLAAEILARGSRPDEALAHVQAAAETALIDVDWLDRCEGLDPIRERLDPAWRLAVQARAAHIWAEK